MIFPVGWVGAEDWRLVQIQAPLQTAVGACPKGTGATEAEGTGLRKGGAQAATARTGAHEAAVSCGGGKGSGELREEGAGGAEERAVKVRDWHGDLFIVL